MNQEYMYITINKPLRGHPAGKILRVKARDRVPVDPYWRKRLLDAKSDDCIKLAKKPVEKKAPEGGSDT